MRTLLLSKTGHAGWELQRSLAPIGYVIALDRQGCLDLRGNFADFDAIAATARKLNPDMIVNAATYTAVAKAENEVALGKRIKASAPGVLVCQAASIDAWLINYSTDYVSDGSGQIPWMQDAPTHPHSVAGRSKRSEREAIAASGARAVVLRTSWVYATPGQNFAKAMLRLDTEGDALNVVADQFGSPTKAELIADVAAHIIRQIVISNECQSVCRCLSLGCVVRD